MAKGQFNCPTPAAAGRKSVTFQLIWKCRVNFRLVPRPSKFVPSRFGLNIKYK